MLSITSFLILVLKKKDFRNQKILKIISKSISNEFQQSNRSTEIHNQNTKTSSINL